MREGERIRRGQLLARPDLPGPPLERDRQRARVHPGGEDRPARPAGGEGPANPRAAGRAPFAAAGALEREEASLLRDEDGRTRVRRELARVGEEARRLTEIRAPVDGHALTIRLSAVHGREGTATMRLLCRKTRPGDRT